MKNIRIYRFACIACVILLGCSALSAQYYEHSAGIRAGFSSGITYKGFFDRQEALGIAGLYNRNGLNATVTYQYHFEPFRNDRYLIYVGGGPFSGNWNSEYSIGMCALAGFEYIMRDLPLVFSVDWRPLLNILKETSYELLDFGVSIRYRFEIRGF